MGAEFTWAYSMTFGSRREPPIPVAAPAVPTQATGGRPEPTMVAKKAGADEVAGKNDHAS